jgi:hypothetical protein
MPSGPLIHHSPTPVSTHLTLHNLANCIVPLTHTGLVPYPGIFIHNIQLWDKGIFTSFWNNLISF